ncbi:carbohydrate ABC transporter permease [Prochlorothrix hollandica]|uniref:Lactose ABC transporter permease n=1 Tax=Prochlorothrix hollandica PCC 9006 = CALU 1027 TaxID=317619 RepID=A0A0M2Q2C9_PROHO|nr:sugar ABC transporter permease [Prochlorothrix hollandica]KKJ01134.1 lactose ABC transporter permease [Prochlorothrix hollandica PCC 9006 = CALU 1027]
MARWKTTLTPYLFLFPALSLLGLTVFWPALQAFYLSFTQYGYRLGETPQWVGLANFRLLLQDQTFWQVLGNTLIYLVGVVPLLMVLPLALAILVNQKLRGMHWFRLAYYTPVIISMVVAGIAWKWLYAETGLLNQWLQMLLGDGALAQRLLPIPWLTSPHLALYSVMAVTVWKGLGYYMVIYLAGLQAIPGDLYEAAAIDGSDGLTKHWDITLPLMRPYLVLVGVISSISATKVFEEVYIMTSGGPLNSSKTVVYYVYERAIKDLDISYGCAIGLVLFLVIFSLSVVRLTLSNQGDVLGN